MSPAGVAFARAGLSVLAIVIVWGLCVAYGNHWLRGRSRTTQPTGPRLGPSTPEPKSPRTGHAWGPVEDVSGHRVKRCTDAGCKAVSIDGGIAEGVSHD